MIVRAILLYTLTTFFASLVAISAAFVLNTAIGPSMRRMSCLAHMTLPATGVALRAMGGWAFCFS